jgi:hypothetical protein
LSNRRRRRRRTKTPRACTICEITSTLKKAATLYYPSSHVPVPVPVLLPRPRPSHALQM